MNTAHIALGDLVHLTQFYCMSFMSFTIWVLVFIGLLQGCSSDLQDGQASQHAGEVYAYIYIYIYIFC